MVIGTYVSPPSLTSAVGVGGAVVWWCGELLLLWALSSESLPPKKNRFILLKKILLTKRREKGKGKTWRHENNRNIEMRTHDKSNNSKSKNNKLNKLQAHP